jgi:uncharacterized membrane protein YedE/YeeE
MQAALHALALLVVFAMGFAAHRASLCTVRAVAEVARHGRFDVLASFGRAALWTAAISGLLVLALAVPHPPIPLREPLPLLLAGGFVFGVGAAVNDGCSLSTLQRLADGDLSMLLTLAGVCVGVLVGLTVPAGPSLALLPSPWPGGQGWTVAVLAALLAWCAFEAATLARARPAGASWPSLLGLPRYSLPLAAAIMGLAGGVLYTVEGAWSYTNFVRGGIESLRGRAGAPPPVHALLVAALVLGMLLSSWQRGGFRPRLELAGVWRERLAGGVLMGIGGALLPGGNDTLLLGAIPTLSPAAFAAYLALLAGIATALSAQAALRRRRWQPRRTDAGGDSAPSSR